MQKSSSPGRGERFEIRSAGKNYYRIQKEEAEKKYIAKEASYIDFSFLDNGSEYIIVSGPMGGNPGKIHDWVLKKPAGEAPVIAISFDDIENYLADDRRDNKVINLVREARTNREGVPCFFVEWQDGQGEQQGILWPHADVQVGL